MIDALPILASLPGTLPEPPVAEAAPGFAALLAAALPPASAPATDEAAALRTALPILPVPAGPVLSPILPAARALPAVPVRALAIMALTVAVPIAVPEFAVRVSPDDSAADPAEAPPPPVAPALRALPASSRADRTTNPPTPALSHPVTRTSQPIFRANPPGYAPVSAPVPLQTPASATPVASEPTNTLPNTSPVSAMKPQNPGMIAPNVSSPPALATPLPPAAPPQDYRRDAIIFPATSRMAASLPPATAAPVAGDDRRSPAEDTHRSFDAPPSDAIAIALPAPFAFAPAVPEPTTAVPEPTTAVPQPTTAVPQPTTAVPQPVTAMPQPATAVPQLALIEPPGSARTAALVAPPLVPSVRGAPAAAPLQNRTMAAPAPIRASFADVVAPPALEPAAAPADKPAGSPAFIAPAAPVAVAILPTPAGAVPTIVTIATGDPRAVAPLPRADLRALAAPPARAVSPRIAPVSGPEPRHAPAAPAPASSPPASSQDALPAATAATAEPIAARTGAIANSPPATAAAAPAIVLAPGTVVAPIAPAVAPATVRFRPPPLRADDTPLDAAPTARGPAFAMPDRGAAALTVPEPAPRATLAAPAAFAIASDTLGSVTVALDGGPLDLRLRFDASPTAATLIAAEAPRLLADLAAQGVRLQSFDIGGQAQGHHQQAQQQGQQPQQQPRPAATAFLTAPDPRAAAPRSDRFA